MIVQKAHLNDKTVHLLLREDGAPVEEVARYMKNLAVRNLSPNTTKAYCRGLKHFYDFLEIVEVDFRSVSYRDLVDFVIWLGRPYSKNEKVIVLDGTSTRAPRTINLYVTAVCEFYRFLAADGMVSPDLIAKLELTRRSRTKSKLHAGFLSHVSSSRGSVSTNLLKAKVPKRRPRALYPDEAAALMDAATNDRDRFLIKLLIETGVRIGEGLGLFIEDISYDRREDEYTLEVVDRGHHENSGSAKTSGRRIPITHDLAEMFDDYLYDVLEGLGCSHPYVFAKIAGTNAGDPMNYDDVRSAFERYSRKIGMHVTPHMLRHTFGTILYGETRDLKLVQELMGHANLATTADLYLHPTEEDVREGWRKAQHRFSFGRVAAGKLAVRE